jgi:hypothetical protein
MAKHRSIGSINKEKMNPKTAFWKMKNSKKIVCKKSLRKTRNLLITSKKNNIIKMFDMISDTISELSIFFKIMNSNIEQLLSLGEASKLTPYSQEYLGLLIRKDRIKGEKIGGKWFVRQGEIERYLSQVANASYERQESLNVKIPAQESKLAMLNLKWAILLVVLVAVVIATWNFAWTKPKDDIEVEKDSQNNLIIHVDDPDSIGSVTVVPK